MVELIEDINALNSVIATLTNGQGYGLDHNACIAVNAIKAIVDEKEKQFNNAEARFLLDEMEYTANEF